MCEVMVLGQKDKLDAHIKQEALTVHQSLDTGSSYEYIGAYHQVFKIIGEGNFVVAYSRVMREGKELARFDLFRLRNGRIEEIWVNQEPVPPGKNG